jgi:aspartyl-tRNA synthetase
MLKTHNCGELRESHIGETVELAGWVNRYRDQGGVVFIDLRDRWGITQVVASVDDHPDAHEVAQKVRGEYVIQIKGTVRARPEGLENPELDTGTIEVAAEEITILTESQTPPFYIYEEGEEAREAIRMKYRYLDLRRPRMQRNIVLRHSVVKYIRDFLDARGFVEIETPILFKTTPEGARDYLVPSRVHPGQFYALPQSPQQLKQLLMVAGYERYFQIARCFRDEDQRGDRQPEFTQLDLEMSFVEREDILTLIEQMYIEIVESLTDKQIYQQPFPRIKYAEVMERFGSDKPDIRYGMELKDVGDIVAKSDFRVFSGTVASGGRVRAIAVPGCAGYSRSEVAELEEIAKRSGAKGLATMAVQEDGSVKSSIAKFFTEEQLAAIVERVEAGPGDLILFAADTFAVTCEVLDSLRREMAKRLELTDPDVLAFLWVIDFPLFEWNADEERWDPSHHLFTSPMPEDQHLLYSDPGAARGQQYDFVCNGYEIAGGSIRIHDPEVQSKVFELIGLDVEVANERFGHMLEAFSYGVPPHGGIAPGIDRIVMLLAGEPNIREVIAFPKTQQAADIMAGAPSEAEPKQLEELHIRVVDKD